MTDRPVSYEIVVGNIGTVYCGADRRTATHTYHSYVRDSNAGYGRVAGEPVTFFRVTGSDVEIWAEHAGKGEQS